MSTYTEIMYQVVFGGKYHIPFIPEKHQDELFAYISGILKNMECFPIIQGGHYDHLHLVFSLSRKLPLSKVVQEVKKSTHIFMEERKTLFPYFDSWQVGYGGFSYSISDREKIIRYVLNQKDHHKTVTFRDEFIRLLEEHGIEYDKRYLFV